MASGQETLKATQHSNRPQVSVAPIKAGFGAKPLQDVLRGPDSEAVKLGQALLL